jgi:hypothetical protein
VAVFLYGLFSFSMSMSPVMRHTYPWAVLVVLVLTTGAGHLYGQDASRAQGRVIVQKEDADAFRGVSQTEKQGWRAGLEKIRSGVVGASLLQPPQGYNVHTGYLATAAPAEGLPWLKASRASLFFQLAPLYEDKGKLLEDPEGGSEIIVQVNTFVYPQTFVPFLGGKAVQLDRLRPA